MRLDQARAPAIVGRIAKAALPPNPMVRWDEWVADYGRIRDLIEETYPDEFARLPVRVCARGMFQPCWRSCSPAAVSNHARLDPACPRPTLLARSATGAMR